MEGLTFRNFPVSTVEVKKVEDESPVAFTLYLDQTGQKNADCYTTQGK